MFLIPLFLWVMKIVFVFGDIRVPVLTAPLNSLPLSNNVRRILVQSDTEYFSKVTIYEIWKALRNASSEITFERIIDSTMFTIFSDARVLLNRGQLTIAALEVQKLYNCSVWCYSVKNADIITYTSYTSAQLTDEFTIKVQDLHNATVETIEKKFCFNMTDLEQKLNLSSLAAVNTDWEKFVPDIVKAAIECRAAELGATTEELAEILRTTLPTLLGYNLNQLEQIFFPAFEDLKSRKNLFEIQAFTVAISGMSQAQWQSKTMSYFANTISNFTVRDLEILYRWETAQIFAIENIPLSSYFSKCSFLSTNSAFNISRSIYGYQAERPSCNVAYILSRSLSEDESRFNLSIITDTNILDIIRNATSISSWFDFYQLLFSISEGIWMEMPFVNQVQASSGRSMAEIRNFSVPQIANLIRSLNSSNSLNSILSTNYPQFLSLLLHTYGFSKSSLASITGNTQANIDSFTIQQAHSLVFNAVLLRYNISEFTSKLNVPGVDSYVAINLPSFEWYRLVRAVIQSSFDQLANAFSVNLTSGSGGAQVVAHGDGSLSIQIEQGSFFNSYRVTTEVLANCLLQNTTVAIYEGTLSSYQTMYHNTVVNLMRKKISFETDTFVTILTRLGITFESIKENETVAETIENRVGLTQEQLRCLYGWSTQFSAFLEGINWANVSSFRLCNDYTKWTLHRILVALQSSKATVCGKYFLDSEFYVFHSFAYVFEI